MEKKKTTGKTLAGILALVAVVAILVVVFIKFGPKTQKGAKNITIEVVNEAGTSTNYNVNTDAEYLQQAMDEAEGLTYEANAGMVEKVNDEAAIWADTGAYWAFYVNGDYCQFGIAEQPVADGDAFQIVFTPAQ